MENLAPYVASRVMKELASLREKPVDGVVVNLEEGGSVSDIRAEIAGPESTPYEGGVFRMRLLLTRDFPNSPPKGYFSTRIFHPNVSETGEICVNTLKRDWSADLGLRHVFTVIRCLLIDPNPESALNEEAGKLLLEDYDEFAKLARVWTEVHALPAATRSAEGPTTAAAAGAGKLKQSSATGKPAKKKSLKRL
mmetsp:Transcript_9206/g.24271  ORF Transcript_9206/g.24271 Transcript_9206/m.24271 type:complete len:194 (-) Transcript_9206:492-1073(-)